MSGKLSDDSVIIIDQREGSQLYNKGNYGYPLSGGGIELDLFEATYLLECARIAIEGEDGPLSFEGIFSHSSRLLDDFDIKYTVYRDLRSRGFIVKSESGTFDLSVFPRGMTMSNSRPIYLVRSVSERSAFDIDTFTDEISQTEVKGKQLLYGVVDEEGDLTYYIMSHRHPKGETGNGPANTKVAGTLDHDRVFVFDPEGSRVLMENGCYGKAMGCTLQLSLIESYYLMEREELAITDLDGRPVSSDRLKQVAEGQDEFMLRLKAFSDMRDKGLVVKTGFKFGTHFRAYEGSPDKCHARYLVHAVDAESKTLWPEISRAVRLAGGVKKEFLFCRVGRVVEYLEFKWFRPRCPSCANRLDASREPSQRAEGPSSGARRFIALRPLGRFHVGVACRPCLRVYHGGLPHLKVDLALEMHRSIARLRPIRAVTSMPLSDAHVTKSGDPA